MDEAHNSDLVRLHAAEARIKELEAERDQWRNRFTEAESALDRTVIREHRLKKQIKTMTRADIDLRDAVEKWVESWDEEGE